MKRPKLGFWNKTMAIHIVAILSLIAGIVSFCVYFDNQPPERFSERSLPQDSEFVNPRPSETREQIEQPSDDFAEDSEKAPFVNGDTPAPPIESNFRPDRECDFGASDCSIDNTIANRTLLVGSGFILLALGLEIGYLIKRRRKKSTETKPSTKIGLIGLFIAGSSAAATTIGANFTPAYAADSDWQLRTCEVITTHKTTGASRTVSCDTTDLKCNSADTAYEVHYCSLVYSNNASETLRGLYVSPGSAYKNQLSQNFFANKDSNENRKNSPTRLEVVYELYKIAAAQFGFELDAYRTESADAVKYSDPISHSAASYALDKNLKRNPKQKWETSLEKNEDPKDVRAAASWALVNQIYSGCKYYEDYKGPGQLWNIIRAEGPTGATYQKYINNNYDSADYIRMCWDSKADRAWVMGLIKNFLVNYVNRKKPLVSAEVSKENAICGYGAKIQDGMIIKTSSTEIVPASGVDPASQIAIKSPIVMVLVADSLFKDNFKNTNLSTDVRLSASCVYRSWVNSNKIIIDSTKKSPGTYFLKTEVKTAIRTTLKKVVADLVVMRDAVVAAPLPPEETATVAEPETPIQTEPTPTETPPEESNPQQPTE
jgi:hypothetical protein